MGVYAASFAHSYSLWVFSLSLPPNPFIYLGYISCPLLANMNGRRKERVTTIRDTGKMLEPIKGLKLEAWASSVQYPSIFRINC